MAADLIIMPHPETPTREPRVLSSQLSGFAVFICYCGHGDPLVIGTLGGVVECPACRERFMISAADFAVDPLSRTVTSHVQIGQLSRLSRPLLPRV